MSASLIEAESKSKSRHLESEAREVVDMAIHDETERDAAHHDLAMARLEIDATGSARAQVESELARVHRALTAVEDARRKVESELDVARQALAASGEACRKAEEETSHLTNERVSLLVELGASKDELSPFCSKVSKEKKALEAECDAGFEVIFNYGYGCCAFTHNICESKLGIPTGIPDTSTPLTPEFFINPQCPPGVVLGLAVVAPEANISEEVKRSSTAGTKVGDNPDSLSKVAGEMEEHSVSGKS